MSLTEPEAWILLIDGLPHDLDKEIIEGLLDYGFDLKGPLEEECYYLPGANKRSTIASGRRFIRISKPKEELPDQKY